MSRKVPYSAAPLRGGRGLGGCLAALVALLALGAPSAFADDARPFHCDGTDPSFFLELQEAGWVGFGETWDHDTCAGGTTIYAPGARQWADMRPKWSLAAAPKVNGELYATVVPVVAFGGLGGIFALAWLVAFLQRRRRVRMATLSCPACATEMPVHLDDPALRNLFCPMCGAPCVLVDEASEVAAAAGAA